jgi:hypothetical protein
MTKAMMLRVIKTVMTKVMTMTKAATGRNT